MSLAEGRVGVNARKEEGMTDKNNHERDEITYNLGPETWMVPLGGGPEQPEKMPLPQDDAAVAHTIDIWLRSMSPGGAQTYATIVKHYLGWLHAQCGEGMIVKEAKRKNAEGRTELVEYVDWDRIPRYEVVKNMDGKNVADYLAHRQTTPWPFIRKGYMIYANAAGGARIKLEYSCLKSLAKAFVRDTIISVEQWTRIGLVELPKKSKAQEPRGVTLVEYEAVLESLRPRNQKDILRALRDRLIIQLAFRYWLRKSELQKLKVENVTTRLVKDNGELGRAYVLSWKAKGSKMREAWLTPDVAESLIVWLRESGLENSPSAYLFPPLYKSGRFRTDPKDPTRIAINKGLDGAIEARFDALYREQGLIRPGQRSYITLNSLRRGGMRSAKDGGADIEDISWDAGHAEINTTQIYLGQRGFKVRHSSEYIQTQETSTAVWLAQERKRLEKEKAR